MNDDHYSRRSFLKKAFRYLASTIFATIFGYSYSRYIEPNQLEINRFDFKSASIPQSFDGLKILQFSDTHIGHYYDLEEFSKLIQVINEQEADLVFFTGDLIDSPHLYLHTNKIAPLLSQISAPLGKYSIYGNHDHGGYGTESYKQIMKQADFTLLVNTSTTLSVLEEKIYIAGLDDYMLGRPDFEQALGTIPEGAFTILLAHEPDVAKISHSYPIQFQLSGHSHGGQIRLPFYGAVVTPPYASEYTDGFYKIGQVPLTLYVNRGIGTTRIPFRFLAKPEITIFTLKKEKA